MNEFHFRVQLPGDFYELNVHFGVFVGGMGDFDELFLGNQENFRGCLDSVFFNGIDVLARAEGNDHLPTSLARTAVATIKDLTWDCSREFEADSAQPISFVEKNAFISFPNWISPTGALIAFKVLCICLSIHISLGCC